MTVSPPEPSAAPRVSVQRGNSWAQVLTCPTQDTGGHPLDWTTSVFTASSQQLPANTIAVAVDTSGAAPVVTLSLTGIQTAAMTDHNSIHWHLKETAVMGGNDFITGRITLTQPS